MARSYHVATAAVALDCSPKWLDNLLTYCTVPGVARRKRGVARRLAPDALLIVAIARELTRELGLAAPRAVMLASRLCARDDGVLVLTRALTVSIDLPRVRRELEARLADAVESTIPPRRGRPPTRRRSDGVDRH